MATDNKNKVYINKDGKKVLRVTEVIQSLAKDQIPYWANMLGFKHIDYKKELERCGNVGTMVHVMIEKFMKSGELPADMDYNHYGVRDGKSRHEVDNALQSFLSWYEDNSGWYRVKFSEKQIIGQKMGGTIDCGIHGIIDPKKVIFVDYKTSPDYYLTQFLQLSGYVRIFEELYGPDKVEGVMVILADKKEGKKARAKIIPREKLDMLMICFDCLYNTALTTKMLNKTWKKLSEDIK